MKIVDWLIALAVIAAVLKLTGVVAWPWWVAMSPLWGPPALVGGLLLLIFVADA